MGAFFCIFSDMREIGIFLLVFGTPIYRCIYIVYDYNGPERCGIDNAEKMVYY